MLRVHVSADGNADAIELKSSSGSARLDEAALDAMRGARFQPYRVDGKAVEAAYDDVGAGTVVVQAMIDGDLEAIAGVTRAADLSLGIPDDISSKALAYLVVVLETRTADQLDADLAAAVRRGVRSANSVDWRGLGTR